MPPPAGRLPSPLESVTREVVGSPAVATPGETSAHPAWWGARVRVDFSLFESAVGLWERARSAIQRVSGRRFVTDEQVLYETALAFLIVYLPLWLEEVADGDPIAVRDRFHCVAPGCTHRCGSAHHIRFRSRGGCDEPWNLVFLCHVHHLEMVHRLGVMKVSGRAPDSLVFRMGIGPDGSPTEVFVNEERVDSRDSTGVCGGIAN
jgi:hypothetical protein